MGYLDGSTITVDAILTQEGRKKLSEGLGLGISKFALGDDGIDYKLYNPNHISGTTFYGEAINNLPNLEAGTDGYMAMRYTLTTMEPNRVFLPQLVIDKPNIIITRQNEEGAVYNHFTTYNHPEEMYSVEAYDGSSIILSVPTKDISGSTRKFAPEQGIPQKVQAGPMKQMKIMAQPTRGTKKTTVKVTGLTSQATAFFTIEVRDNIRTLKS
jgi:hypothetical protein